MSIHGIPTEGTVYRSHLPHGGTGGGVQPFNGGWRVSKQTGFVYLPGNRQFNLMPLPNPGGQFKRNLTVVPTVCHVLCCVGLAKRVDAETFPSDSSGGRATLALFGRNLGIFVARDTRTNATSSHAIVIVSAVPILDVQHLGTDTARGAPTARAAKVNCRAWVAVVGEKQPGCIVAPVQSMDRCQTMVVRTRAAGKGFVFARVEPGVFEQDLSVQP